jgi:organic hydroperoxide reductase OsmC/OhrA
MQDYPHLYAVSADGGAEGEILVSSAGLEDIPTTAPPQFGGPEGSWSPETLLVASVANCFILTFRAIARGSRFEWSALQCSVRGTLDRVDNVTSFTRFEIDARLTIPAASNRDRAERLLEKSEAVCLVTNSLTGEKILNATILVK